MKLHSNYFKGISLPSKPLKLLVKCFLKLNNFIILKLKADTAFKTKERMANNAALVSLLKTVVHRGCQNFSSPLCLSVFAWSAYRSPGRKTKSRLPFVLEKKSCKLGIILIWQIAFTLLGRASVPQTPPPPSFILPLEPYPFSSSCFKSPLP